MKNNKREPPNRLNLRYALRGATFVCIIGVTAVGAIGGWSVVNEDPNNTTISFISSSHHFENIQS